MERLSGARSERGNERERGFRLHPTTAIDYRLTTLLADCDRPAVADELRPEAEAISALTLSGGVVGKTGRGPPGGSVDK